MSIEVHPLTPDRWDDLVTVFGENGAQSGCWCMWWRESGAEFERNAGAGNRRALRAFVEAGTVPGLLAYVDGQPAGWCSVAPREEYVRLERSRALARVDDSAVWSIVCFFIHRRFRGRGVAAGLLRAAVDYAAAHGAAIVEGYPIEPGVGRLPSSSIYTGVISMFSAAGFEEVARRSAGRPIMRYPVDRTNR